MPEDVDVGDFLEGMVRLQETIGNEIVKAFNDNSFYAEDLVVMQLQKGQGALRQLPPYSDSSVNRYGKPPGPWRLKETGSTYRGITQIARGEEIEGFTTDPKNDDLEERLEGYGPFELGADSAGDMARQMEVSIYESISKKTGLT